MCREERYQEVRSATMTLGKDYFYDSERVSFSTACKRCSDKDLCDYESVKALPESDLWRGGYHWTNKDCFLLVKINSEGYIALVHDIDSSQSNTIPYHVKEENTLNYFRVFWDSEYPGSSVGNDCAANNCKVLDDGA
ncbi:hypothetical protein ACHAXN_001560 [Cyclotella atomus]